MSVAEYLALVNETGGKRPKYGSQAVRVDGQRFDSKLEARRYSQLVLLRAAGEILWFTRQVPFRLASGVSYRADFLIRWDTTRPGYRGEPVTIEDVKGMLTDGSRIKIRMVEREYGFTVQLLTKAHIG